MGEINDLKKKKKGNNEKVMMITSPVEEMQKDNIIHSEV